MKRGAGSQPDRFVESVRRAFAEFLTIPTLLIGGFLVLAAAAYYLDQVRASRDWPPFIAGSHESLRTLLGTIAASIITVTSITFSLLLLAVQQSAGALTGQVYDQFLRRRANQVYFGFFIGLALYCLVILATVRQDYTPVYGAAIAFGLTVVALLMLTLLIYASIDQMRPVSIVGSIRDYTLAAREGQRSMLASTRDEPLQASTAAARFCAGESGYLAVIDFSKMDELCRTGEATAEVVLLRCIGDYVSIGEELIEIRCSGEAPDPALGQQLLSTMRLEGKRDLATDPSYGIEQLVNIAWTTISTSKQNPQPGRLACRALRDCVAHWYNDDQSGVARGASDCPIVLRDRVPTDLVRAFETLIVVSSESMQHHTLAEVYRALALALKRVPGELRGDIEQVVVRSLAMLADHGLTAELDESISALLEAMTPGPARSAVSRARDRLAETLGILNSRSSRVENPLRG